MVHVMSPSHQDTYVQGFALTLFYRRRAASYWVALFAVIEYFSCSACTCLLFEHTSIISQSWSMRYLHLDICQLEVPWPYDRYYMKAAAYYAHPCRVSNRPQRSSPTTQLTNVEPPMIMAIWGSMIHVTQDKPRHDCNTRNTSVRHHPLHLSIP